MRRQIVQIGAGFDTTYFRLRQKASAPVRYVEVDYAEVVEKKAAIINSKPELADQMMVGRRGVYPCELTMENGDVPPGRGLNPAGPDDGSSSRNLLETSPSHAYRDDGGYRLVAADLRDVESLTAVRVPTLGPDSTHARNIRVLPRVPRGGRGGGGHQVGG